MTQARLESWSQDPRKDLLVSWANDIHNAARGGHLDGRPIAIAGIRPVIGPRAGALRMKVGITHEHARHAGRLVKALSADSHAALRSLIPGRWRFTSGQPLAYMDGTLVRVEAPWPDHLSQKIIRLDRMSHHPLHSKDARLGRWIAGQSEKGSTVTLGLDDQTPHFLLAGMTGSGKSVALLGMVYQLTQDKRHRLVLFDGKFGDELVKVSHTANMIGPMVVELDAAKSALTWLVEEMKTRYGLKLENRLPEDKIIVVWDEPQEWLSDKLVADLVQLLVRDGRGAGVHMVLATHHPVVSVFGGPEAKRNFPGRLALRVADPDASRVALGFSKPSASTLTGSGDAILSTPGVMALRAQIAFVDQVNFDQIPQGEPELAAWPDFTGSDIAVPTSGFSPEETAAGLVAAYTGKGRPTLRRWVQALTGAGQPGGSKAQRLQGYTGALHGILSDDLGLDFPKAQLSNAIEELDGLTD